MNGGTKTDLAAVLPVTDEVSFLLGKSDGSFQDGQTDARYSPSVGEGAHAPVQVEIVDLNQDGFGDLVTTNHFTHNISVLINKMIIVGGD